MLRVADGLAVASLHSSDFRARRRALPGKSSYCTRPEFLGLTLEGVWRGDEVYPTAVSYPYGNLRTGPCSQPIT